MDACEIALCYLLKQSGHKPFKNKHRTDIENKVVDTKEGREGEELGI